MYIYQKHSEKPRTEFTGYMVDETADISKVDYRSIYRSKQYESAMNYFDITDDRTRAILLSVNEADQNVVMQELSSKLYKQIVDKVDEIDFGTIPQSKGDITKIDNYDKLVECVNIIGDLLAQYHQDTTPIEVVSTAMNNMVDRIDLFTKAYRLNVEMPMIIYNTIVLAIVDSVSFMISSCIEFVKLPDNQGFDIAVDKVGLTKSKERLVFDDLSKFNKFCATGDFDKAMDYIMKGNANNFAGGAFAFGVSSAVVMLGLVLLIIPVIRELIFFFYYSRTKVADYFEAQADLLLINSYNVEHSLTRDEKTRKEIAGKQRKIADSFKKIADGIKIKSKTGKQKADKEIKKADAEKYKADDVLDKVPDSANSVLF